MDKLFIGVDVSKAWVDIAIAGTAQTTRVDNSHRALTTWVETIDVARVALVAFEPTGGYERILRKTLRRAGVPFVRLHVNEVVAFRKSRGLKAKTDRIDARLIADFARDELSKRNLHLAVEDDEALRELVARRRQVRMMLHAERCRAAIALTPAVKASLKTLINALTRQLAKIEQEIADHISASSQLRERERLLRTLKGVGPVVAATLLGELPELGRFDGKEIAALVGLAPCTRESGKQTFRATTGFGRPGVRGVLFNAARSAIRYSPYFKDFYDRLVIDNKRPGKVALTAVMRKMLVTLNAIARDNEPWKHADA